MTFYPLGLIEKLVSKKLGRVISDPFENGSSAARNTWPDRNFKRQLTLQHAPLTATEWRTLRAFYSARNGRYDSFFFRDNVHRDGNVLVRFGTDLQAQFQGSARHIALELDEVAAIRALPEFDEVATAAGSTPVLWYDANREVYYQHLGSVLTEPAVYDSQLKYPAAWQSGSLQLGGVLTQYQTYNFIGTNWAKTAVNISEFSTTQPACTIFAICRQSALPSTPQMIFQIGQNSNTHALGLLFDTAGFYVPWIGPGHAAWSSIGYVNSPADTWRSHAITWPASSNSVSQYVNAALINSDTNSRSYTAGPAALGADTDGATILNPSNAGTNSNIAHVLLFASALTLAQIKAVHNLLGYQYGLSIVA